MAFLEQDGCLMPRPQKSTDTTIDLPQELKDIGFEELRIKDENGIIKLEDDSLILFPFYLKNYVKSIEKLKENLLARKLDERIVMIACTKITEVLVKSDFYHDNGGKSKEVQQTPDQETQLLVDEINVLIEKYKDIPYEVWEQERAKRYQALRQAVQGNIPDAWESMEFVLTGKGILHISDVTLPFIGIILGNPSTYKTVAIEMLRKWYNTYYVDKISPRSFVSHAHVEGGKGELENIDLIQKIRDKLLLIPELSPIFMSNEETLVDILSTFVRLADGKGLLVHSGLHGLRGVDCSLMFAMIGASVEIPPSIYKLITNLGPKLYFYRTNSNESTEQQLQEEITGKNFEVKCKEIKDSFFDYLRWLEVCPLMINIVSTSSNSSSSVNGSSNDVSQEQREHNNNRRRVIEWNKAKDDKRAIEHISKIAILLSKIRGNVYTHQTKTIRFDEEDNSGGGEYTSYEYGYSQPIMEKASRANAVLYNVARSHAFEIHGRDYITMEDIPILVKIALSTANRDRVSMLKLLITKKEKNGKHKERFSTKDLIQMLNVSKSTARRVMKELQVLGLVQIIRDEGENHITLEQKFGWLLKVEFDDLIQGFVNQEHEQDQDQEHGQQQESVERESTTTIKKIYDYSCYYCENFQPTNQRSNYENHIILLHPGKLSYPSKADLEKLGLQRQGKSWEI